MFLFFLLFAFIFPSNGQYLTSSATEWITPNDCGDNQYFNSISFKCQKCEDQMKANSERNGCECLSPFRLDSNRCTQCPTGQISNGILCVECQNDEGTRVNAETNGNCPKCADNSIRLIVSSLNVTKSICSICPPNTHPNIEQTECIQCEDRQCLCSKNPSICSENSSPPISNIIITGMNRQISSEIVERFGYISEIQCRSGHRPSCQQLANLCVLQNYDRDTTTACSILDSLRTGQNSDLIPPIVYLNTEASVELFRESAIDAIFNVAEGMPNTELEFLLGSYAFNGTFLGFSPIQSGILQMCPNRFETLRGAFKFGRLYQMKCKLTVDEIENHIQMMEKNLLGQTNGTIFHEIYLRYITTTGEELIYNVPILNENIRSRSEYVNRLASDTRWILTRRFYLTDRQKDPNSNSNLIRIPTQMSFHIHLQLSRDGRIFPPHFRIRFGDYFDEENIPNAETDQTVLTEFQIIYVIDSFRHDKTIEVIMATFCSSCVLWGALKAYSWSRRAGKLVVDATTMAKFVLNVADNIANIFLLVMASTAMWITFAYKLQKHMVYVPLTFQQEWSMVIYVITATALKALALIHTYLKLIFTETFFVDWERPRTDRSRETTMFEMGVTNETMSQRQKKSTSVVIWRTYLIANEWNELQYYRKTSIALQCILIVILLESFHFGDYAIIQTGFSRGEQPVEYAETRMSRFAVNVAAYLLIEMLQWIFTVLIIEKIADPFRNFMDLCSVANISVLTFTHPLRAYYIHGRSVHGTADTDMLEMNTFLQREKENLCGLRGLESSSELQTFIVSLPRAFRDRIDELTATIRSPTHGVNIRAANGDKVTTKVEGTAKMHAEITQYIKDFIDHADPNCDYVITDSRLIEELLDIEMADTTRIGTFIRDPSEMAYSSVFIYGNEWSHTSFEMLLFCAIDMATGDRLLSAAIVFITSTLIMSISKIFFTNNLVKTSMVDHRFLI